MEVKLDIYGLIKALTYKKDPEVRRVAAFALSRLCDARALDVLIVALKDQDAVVRYAVAIALGKIGNSQSVDALLFALEDQDESVRREVVNALVKIGDARAEDALVSVLNNQDYNLRMNAAKALADIGGEHKIDGLLVSLTNLNGDVRRESAVALGKTGDKRAVDGLVVALKDQEYSVRKSATEALGIIGGENTVNALIIALQNPDPNMRSDAVQALGNIRDARAVDALITALKDQDYIVRWQAAGALGKIGDARVVDALVAIIHDDQSEKVRSAATGALEKIEGARARVLPGLYAELFNADKTIRARVAEAIRILKPNEDGFPHLVRSLLENDENVNCHVRGAIDTIFCQGPAAKEAVPQLLAAWEKAPQSADVVFMKILDKIGTLPPIDLVLKRWDEAPELLDYNFIGILNKIGVQPQAIDLILKRLFAHCEDDPLREAPFKAALVALIPVSFLTEEIVNCAVKASSIRTCDSITRLCSMNSPVSSNILHLVAKKRDITIRVCRYCNDWGDEIWSFKDERNQALNELRRRGNPPYQPEAYYKTPPT